MPSTPVKRCVLGSVRCVSRLGQKNIPKGFWGEFLDLGISLHNETQSWELAWSLRIVVSVKE